MENRGLGQYLVNKMAASGIAAATDHVGCTPQEVELVKQAQHVTYLPPLYVDILLHLGKGTKAPFFQGEDYTFSSLLRLKSELKSVAENVSETGHTSFTLPPSAFVFLGHQGAGYWYFETIDMDPDPSVFLFADDGNADGPIRKVSSNLSEFYINELNECIEWVLKASQDFGSSKKDSRT